MAERGVICDFDLTVADTRRLNDHTTQRTLNYFGVQMSPDEFKKMYSGRTLTDFYRALLPGVSAELACRVHLDMEEVVLAEAARNRERIVPPFPGVLETLWRLKLNSYGLGIASNRRGTLIPQFIQDYYLQSAVTGHVQWEDVKNPKPHPEAILKTADCLGLRLENCWVVGDSKGDIKAGKAAGARGTIAVDFGADGPSILAADPDHLVSSFDLIHFIVTHDLRRRDGEGPVVWRNV